MTTHDTIPAPPPSGVVPRVLASTLAPFKACACGRAYTADEWEELERIGIGGDEDLGDGLPREPYELRNCVCGSTIAVYLHTEAP